MKTLEKIKQDLEVLGLIPFEETLHGEDYLNCAIDIEKEFPINFIVRESGEFIAISTVELFSVQKSDLESILRSLDDIPLGKYFLSKDLNTHIDAEELYLDYGFEIPIQFYSKEFLQLQLEVMTDTLKNNL